MFAVTYRRNFFIAIALIALGSIAALVIIRPSLSIEFTGGSLVEVAYQDVRPSHEELVAKVGTLNYGNPSVRESGANGVTVRTRTLTPEEHVALLAALSDANTRPLTELRFNSIGPSIGNELAIKALYAIAAVILAIVLYIAWAFRHVSRPVSSWVYGLIVVAILVHDLLIPAGFFAIYSFFTGAQIDTLFVVALLAILGYSVNDTIVIFDRVREHLRTNEERNVRETFEVTVGKSITETLGRSINTSVTVILALIALAVFGSKETIEFALVLLAGVVAGTYSSILLAAPLLVPLSERFATKTSPKKK
ncbi:MAG: Protein-export rane protein SecF [Parcubacteria group bacterium]|nr:Protein-export rane protein SecF [Parcubacteria group bacterium]